MWPKWTQILKCPRTYFSATITSGLLIGTLLLWQTLLQHEDRKIESQARAYGEGIRRQLQQELNDRVLTFVRLANREHARSSESAWRQEAESLLRHLPGTLALTWVNLRNQAQLSHPRSNDFASNLAPQYYFLQSARRSRHFLFTDVFVLESNSPGILLFVPVFKKETYQGSLAVLMDLTAFFRAVVDTPHGYSFELRDHKLKLFSTTTDAATTSPSIDVPLSYNTLHWSLAMRPPATTLYQERDQLPFIFLVCGILISLLFGIVLWLLSSKWAADQEIAGQKRFLQSIIDHLPVGLFCKDSDRGFEYTIWNKMASQLWGFSQSDVIGKTDHEIFPEEQAHAFGCCDRLALAGNAPLEIHEEVVTSQYNGPRLARTLKIPVADKRGRMRYVMGFSHDITEQKQAEESLKQAHLQAEAEKLFAESITHLVPDNIYILDLPTKSLVYINQNTESFLGLSLEQVRELGENFLPTIVHPADLAHVLGILENFATKADGEIVEFQQRIRHSDHGWRWCIHRETVFKRDPSGNPTQIIGAAQDITEFKVAKEKLERAGHELERKVELRTNELRQLADSMPQNVWTSTIDGKIDYCNQRWYHFTGASVGCDFNAEWGKILHPDDRNSCGERFMESLSAGQPFEAEYRLWDRRRAEYRWYLGRAIPAQNSQGEIIKWIGTCTDIHDQKMATEKAHTAEQYLKTVLNSLPIILWATDREGCYTLTEGRTLQNIGLTPQEKIGQSHFEFLKDDPKSCERTRRALEGEVSTGEAHLRGCWFDTRYSPIYSQEGSIMGMVGISIDITDKKQIQEEKSQVLVREKAALEASRLKSEFIANMSHEIRTPINGVIGMVDLLLDTSLSEEQKNYTQSILTSADSLLTIVNDILDLSKIEAGKVEIERVPFNLSEAFQVVDQIFEHQAQSKGLIFEKTLAPDLPVYFLGDPTRLRQVLLNLVSNAVKFTLHGRIQISVTYQNGDDLLKFVIQDTGIGIASHAQQHLFQPFCQADSSTTRQFGGTGLGLSISKRLIELMGGDIGFTSQEGQGSTFWFTVPVQIATEAAKVPERKSSVVFDRALKILLAEDNLMNQLVTVKMLERYGHQVEVVGNGRAALRAVERETFDLVLMDCQMPELDGYETTRQLRASTDPKIRSLPVIAMTANAMSGDREACLQCGMNDYLAKPIRSEELAQTIYTQLRPSRTLTPQSPSELMN